jgi:hypothetical protein
MFGFSDSRKPNVLIASIGSSILLISSIITYAFFQNSRWGANTLLLLITRIIFGAVNITAVTMSVYALLTSYQNGWLSNGRLSRPVLGTAPWVLYFWGWRLFLLLREIF